MPLDAETIFHEARLRPSGPERHAYLDGACAGDAALRARVDALLRADDEADRFLETVEPRPDDGRRAVSVEEPGQQIGRYKLLQRIGEGGFGSVWMAEQREPVKRRVALKIIKLGMDTRQVIARFEAERQALAMMDHPNIARVLDAGSTDTGRPYFVMEYVRGVNILEYCDTARLDTQQRLRLFVKVCNAIQHAHQKGIVHRDLKPGNVLVTLHDGEPVPKVIDFGVAKATSSELTQKTLFTEHRQMIGTPAYMSPEQAEMSGLDIDTRSDIYSLGVLLYELLTGTTPFDSRELMQGGFAEMMRIIREQEPHKPSTRLSTLGETASRTAELRHADPRRLGLALRGDLDWIVMKCLEKDRTRRYETANGLAADIRRHLSDEPVVAGPPTAMYRVRKFLHRNRGAVSVAAVIVLLLVASLWISLAALVGAREDRDRARDAEHLALAAQHRLAAERDRAVDAEAQAEAEAERARAAEEKARRYRHLFGRETLSIAVLPLADRSPDSDQEHLAIGVTESLIADLNRIDALTVKPIDSVVRLVNESASEEELRRLLDVDLILRGSVMRVGDQVRIATALEHPGTDSLIWAGNHEGPWPKLFDLQREVSQDIVHEVEVKLTEQDRQRLARRETTDPRVGELYFKGLENLRTPTETDIRQAIDFFDRALAIDPEFVLAHVGRARAFFAFMSFDRAPSTYMPAARNAAVRAIELDDTVARAWTIIGFVRLHYDWDWNGAHEAFQTAINLEPDQGEAYLGMAAYFVAVGDSERAIEFVREAVRIDPATLLLYECAHYVPFMTRDYDVAIEMCRYAIDLDEDYWSPHAWLGVALAWKGETEAGVRELESALADNESALGMALLASAYAMNGQERESHEMLDRLLEFNEVDYICPYEIATVFIALGDIATAFTYLDRAVHARSECMPFLGTDPRLDEVRDEPDFDRIMEAVGHPMRGRPAPR